ncbi:MAG: hypothetical protein IJY93_00055 [Clostridia bacterium]|nr:hypothetical protein [Clostridia bacterium]
MKGFYIHTVEGGYVPPFEHLPADGLTPAVGMALVLTEGKLTLASGATKPTHISMCQREGACADGELIPVTRVNDAITFAVPSSVANAVAIGGKVTISDDGLNVTATTDGGVATIVGKDGEAEGDIQYVKFI